MRCGLPEEILELVSHTSVATEEKVIQTGQTIVFWPCAVFFQKTSACPSDYCAIEAVDCWINAYVIHQSKCQSAYNSLECREKWFKAFKSYTQNPSPFMGDEQARRGPS